MRAVCVFDGDGAQCFRGKVLIPRTFTARSLRSAKRGQTAMDGITHYFVLLLVVAVLTEPSAEGKNDPQKHTFAPALFSFFGLMRVLSGAAFTSLLLNDETSFPFARLFFCQLPCAQAALLGEHTHSLNVMNTRTLTGRAVFFHFRLFSDNTGRANTQHTSEAY